MKNLLITLVLLVSITSCTVDRYTCEYKVKKALKERANSTGKKLGKQYAHKR